MNNTPFYLNWTFWSFVVAFSALFISLLPKVILLFKGKKINLDVHNRITVNHWLGVPSIGLFLGVTNKGRAKVKIKKIELIVSNEQKTIARLKCTSFFDTTTSQSPNLFFPFELLIEESWDHSCWFAADMSRNNEQMFRSLLSSLDKNISDKFKEKKQSEDKEGNELIEADEELVRPLVEFKEKNYIWEPGEYFIEVKIETDPPIDNSKNIRFTLFETDTIELKSYSNDYKFGISYHNQKNKGIGIPISEDTSKKI